MSTLKERLEEVMAACGWTHKDVVRLSGQSSSVVSQWLGKGSKEIKSIGKVEAAFALARASGYSATWLAKGIGPKRRVHVVSPGAPTVAAEPTARYIVPSVVLEDLTLLLARVPPDLRTAVADLLSGIARDSGSSDQQSRLQALEQLLGINRDRTEA